MSDRRHEVYRIDTREWAVWCHECDAPYRDVHEHAITFTSRRMADRGALRHFAFDHREDSAQFWQDAKEAHRG